MKRSRRRGSGSGPFLMEMILVTGFFIICASICVLVFARANRLSQRASDINQAVLEAQTLAEEMKAGLEAQTLAKEMKADLELNLGTILPSRDFWPYTELTEEQEARRELIRSAKDYSTRLPAWDADWNRYADAGVLGDAGKDLAYVGIIYSGTVDNMRMTDIQIFRYEKGQGTSSLLFQLSTDSYIKPEGRGGSHEQE